jgi:hypothetical protein
MIANPMAAHKYVILHFLAIYRLDSVLSAIFAIDQAR